MKDIPLTKGAVALVDDEDYKFLSQWKQKGELPVPVLRIGRAVRINRAEYEKWIQGEQERGQSQD